MRRDVSHDDVQRPAAGDGSAAVRRRGDHGGLPGVGRRVNGTAIGCMWWTKRRNASYGVRVPRSLRETAAVLTAAALLGGGAAGCSTRTGEVAQPLPTQGPTVAGTSSTAGPSTTAPASPTGSDPATVDRTQVLAVYTGWWRALETAYAAGDPDSAALARYAVDPILARQRASIRSLKAQGIVQRTRFALTPRIRYQAGNYAEVEDCVRGPANTYYDAATGRPRAPQGYRNDAPTEDRLLMTLQRRGEEWFVVAATAKGEVRC